MENYVNEILKECQAIMTDDHFVYRHGDHGSAYVNKDAIYPHPMKISLLCRRIAEHFKMLEIDTVIGPEKGGIILAQWSAFHLTSYMNSDVKAVFAEKEGDDFFIRRGMDKFVQGQKVLIVEDVLTTGGTVIKIIKLVKSYDADIIGVGALCNRSAITAESLGVKDFFALLNVPLEKYPEEECPLCAKGISINTQVGKGKEFLAKKGIKA